MWLELHQANRVADRVSEHVEVLPATRETPSAELLRSTGCLGKIGDPRVKVQKLWPIPRRPGWRHVIADSDKLKAGPIRGVADHDAVRRFLNSDHAE